MTKNNQKIVLVIPAYNEEKTIASVISQAKKYVSSIVVVDDGSQDRTFEIAKNLGVVVYRHCFNLGLGASLVTGFQAALNMNADIIVSCDADGQHQSQDIEKVVAPILEGQADVAIGTRFKGQGQTPWIRKIYNYSANILTFLLYNKWVSDSQSGLRAFKASCLREMEFLSQRMEISSEIIGQIKKRNLKLIEVPITAIYTPYSLSKGQNFFEGLRTAWALLLDKVVKA